ncbi:hypothetical protein CON07_07060 [Bacillus sp. AFS094611]|uniref:Uncharacterized protein n=2 Tax=Bacillus cereus group TaxID=86661 RepID=A0A2A7D355_BACAN|nr:hypothetical protein BK707_09210 [Bacillus thuringiensis serovar coreanensis]OTX41612.1 hypothetical protein BK724_30585 [Bacillus thuringiensis serovar sooncheon]OTX47615.1 hypothetical protein BK725_29520 [Bacillus thuringiensis serovar guiyangiensis]OTX65994.1 hypothetical protein BK727_24545 [Bacillus thuringiensis serovar roskildiensis]PDZ14453.1 hypothetical protein CON16_24345 [Bacillus anthracis]PDZ51863.1 hypothetical protein CON07_07060 [Bacillus sp. AFS094611]
MKIVFLHVTIYSFSFAKEKKNAVEETRIFKMVYRFLYVLL